MIDFDTAAQEDARLWDGPTEPERSNGSAASIDLFSAGFSGDRLRALRERPVPESPLEGLLDSQPSLAVLSGKPKTAKTTFAPQPRWITKRTTARCSSSTSCPLSSRTLTTGTESPGHGRHSSSERMASV